MDRESYKDFYEAVSTKYSPEDGEHYYRHDRFFNVRRCASKGKKEGKIILDVGCGNGYQTAPLTEKNTVYGLDISKANVDKALSRGIKAILHDVEAPFPFEDGFFDVVVCSEILEHLFFPEKVIKECYRVLKDSGSFIVTVPNLYCFRNRLSILTGRAWGCTFIEYPLNQQHIRFFSLDGVRRILEKVGFKVEGFRGQDFAMNFNWPFQIIWYLHGGSRGLRALIKLTTFGKKACNIPGLIFHFNIFRFLGWLLPRLSPGLIFECKKSTKKNRFA
jgi:methionine biosynthesis protein MetW